MKVGRHDMRGSIGCLEGKVLLSYWVEMEPRRESLGKARQR